MSRRGSAHTDLGLGDNWAIRRLWMKLILAWMLCNAQYIIIWGEDTALLQNALVTLLGAIVAILGSYVFGAVWDDREKRKRFFPPAPDCPPTAGLGDGE